MKLTCLAGFLATLSLVLGCTSEQSPPTTATSGDSGSSAPVASSSDEATAVSTTVTTESPGTIPSEPVADTPALTLPEGALSIGSKAPALDIEHWVSNGNGAFQAVTEFDADKVYIVEFWATWCGPCVQSMPHLVELQEKYKDSVQVVSVSNEDLDTVTSFLDKPYSGGGEDGPQTYGELTSAYCLTTDPDRSVGMAYMEAAGQNGIPACFVVGKTGLIEWIGHPMALDEPLSKIVDGTWDREPFAAEFQKEQMFGLIMGQIFEAAQSGDMEKAHQLLEQARGVAGPREMRQLESMEMQLKMAPIAKLMQEGNMDAAITEMEKLVESIEGPMKEQMSAVLNQLKTVQAAQETEPNDVVAPAE